MSSVTSTTVGSRRVFYGWWIVLASIGCLAVGSGIAQWSFGAFVNDLEAEFGWSRAQVAGAPSVGLLALAVASPLAGLWVDRLSIRSAVVFGAVMTAISFAALGLVQELWQFYLLYVCSTFFRVWTSYIPFSALTNRWFIRYRGRAVGLTTMGYGLGGFVFAPVITFLVSLVGWRPAYALSGAMIAVVLVPLALLVIRDRPEQVGLRPDGDDVSATPSSHPHRDPSISLSLRQAMASRSFWVLNLAIALLWTSQVSYAVHGQPFFESRGYAAGTAAALLGGSTLGAGLIRGGSGFVYDLFRTPRILAFLLCVAGAGGLLVLSVSSAGAILPVFFVLWGIGAGGGPIMPPLLLARYYGSAHLGALLGFTEVTSAIMVFGPITGGAIYDATGSYTAAFALFSGVLLASGFLFLLASPPGASRDPADGGGGPTAVS